ncbi:MAG: purine nucleoside permease [Verrucomicrobia bacterium]|nr:purine nucleoside permease [Verrucomicrobiota bacterium]
MKLRFLFAIWFMFGAAAVAADAVIRPKVVVVAMFEPGQDTGDAPGELQFWVEREKLDRVIPLPAAYHDVRANADGSVIAIVTGIGNTRAAATVMALGTDPRFDLRTSYWLVAGIAGVDPADASLASAAWAEWIVNGDLGHELDPREAPRDWPTGYVPLRKSKPYELPRNDADSSQVFHLDPGLVNWAYEFTKNITLPDTAGMAERRKKFAQFPNAQRPPFVLKGDTISAETFWHGKLLSKWADDWVKYHTDGRGNYVMTAMEDTGTLQSLTWLARAGRVDVKRALVLRTASNCDQQEDGMTAAESLFGEKLGSYSAYVPSLESAYRVGSAVVHELVADWARYEKEMPKK